MSRFDRPVLRLAASAALLVALALTLSACGRRGPLDPPGLAPQSTSTDIQTDAEGRPLAPVPTGRNRRIPLDVLLD